MIRDPAEFNENCLRDWLFAALHSYFSPKTKIIGESAAGDFHVGMFERMFHIHKEAKLEYLVGDDHRISHKCDLLLSLTNPKMSRTPILNVEIKYKSSVTDAFKARAYDQQHLKRDHKFLFGVLAYVKPKKSSISFKHAQVISYPFDGFVFVGETEMVQLEKWDPLFGAFENRMKAIASDPNVPAVGLIETGKKPKFPWTSE
jgi:hypothetical protein